MNPEMDFPCYRIMKDDLLKVGRVRFKVREIVSPVYRELELRASYQTTRYKQMYPSFCDDSVLNSSMADEHS